MKSWVLSLLVLFSFLHIDLYAADQGNKSCSEYLSLVPGDYMSYVEKAEEKRGDSKKKHPQFINPKTEKELAKLWAGEVGPEALQKLLPPGVTFVGHQLRKASAPGVVKIEQKSGDFLILRVEMDLEGKKIATNVTINAQSLYQNLERSIKGEKLWLIGPDATAALDWGHGGGTKTTGGHTADTLMNYMAKYNVFTFGMDQPWHGEGPREWFENEEDYFRFRVAFRNQFVHPDVPTFLIGHSKGGIVADMALRRTGKKFSSIGLDQAYAGMISLSFVPDPKPGSNFKDRTTKERQKDMEQKMDHVIARMNPGDCKLFANLMAEDKISALSGLKCTQLSMGNSWEKGVEVSLPSLYVMGEHDALYLLSEDSIEEHVRSLKDSTLWTFSSRVSFRGELEPIGHMIFDHYMPRKDHPEAVEVIESYLKKEFPSLKLPSDEKELQELFKEKVLEGHVNKYSFLTEVNNYSSTLVLMAYHWVPGVTEFLDQRIAKLAQGQSLEEFKANYFLDYTDREVFETYQVIKDFIATTLNSRGVELKEVTSKDRLNEAQKNGDVLANQRESIIKFLKTYGNNLGFREFLETYTYMDMGATKEFEELNQVAGVLTQRTKILTAINKEKISEEEKAKKIAALDVLTDDLGNQLEPGDLKGTQEALSRIHSIRNKKWIPETKELADFAEKNIELREQNATQLKALEAKKEEVRKEWTQLKKQVAQLEAQFESKVKGASSKALKDYEARREELYNNLESYDLKVRDVQEAFLVEVLEKGESLVNAFEHLPKELLATYEEAEKASAEYQDYLSQGKKLIEEEAQNGNFGVELQKLYQETLEAKEKTRVTYRKFADLEYGQVTQAREEQDQLLAEYVEKVVPQYFKITQVNVGEVLSQPVNSAEDFRNAYKLAEKAYAYWQSKVVISKPEGGDTSLY